MDKHSPKSATNIASTVLHCSRLCSIMMHALLDTTQVIGTLSIEGAPYEVCAEAVASHDRHSNQLTVQLRAFLRAENQDHIGEITTPSWLPEPQTVVEHVESGEAYEVANDVFNSWRQKVAGCLPK
jgi:hypothetical protein